MLRILINNKNMKKILVIPSFGICNPEGSNIRICNPV